MNTATRAVWKESGWVGGWLDWKRSVGGWVGGWIGRGGWVGGRRSEGRTAHDEVLGHGQEGVFLLEVLEEDLG